MLYKLTKGTISVIRTDKASVAEAVKDGYRLDGEVNEAYEVVNPVPFFGAETETKEEAPKKRGRPAASED